MNVNMIHKQDSITVLLDALITVEKLTRI